jgi:hypothetical protein
MPRTFRQATRHAARPVEGFFCGLCSTMLWPHRARAVPRGELVREQEKIAPRPSKPGSIATCWPTCCRAAVPRALLRAWLRTAAPPPGPQLSGSGGGEPDCQGCWARQDLTRRTRGAGPEPRGGPRSPGYRDPNQPWTSRLIRRLPPPWCSGAPCSYHHKYSCIASLRAGGMSARTARCSPKFAALRLSRSSTSVSW